MKTKSFLVSTIVIAFYILLTNGVVYCKTDCSYLEKNIVTCLKENSLSGKTDCLETAAEAAEEDECTAYIHMIIGETFYNCKYYADAVSEYTKMIEFGETDKIIRTGYLFRADASIEMCEYEDAVIDLTEAIESDIENEVPNFYTSRGIANLYMGNEEEALDDFQEAVEIAGETTQLVNLAETYLYLQDAENASQYIELALQGIPEYRIDEDPEALALSFYDGWFKENNDFPVTGQIYDSAVESYEDEDYKMALVLFHVVYFLNPYDADIAYYIANAYDQYEMQEEAIDYYLRFMCLNDNEEENEEIENRVYEIIESNDACIWE